MLSFYRARYLFDTGPGRWLYRASVLERTPEELEAEFNNEYAGEDPGPSAALGAEIESAKVEDLPEGWLATEIKAVEARVHTLSQHLAELRALEGGAAPLGNDKKLTLMLETLKACTQECSPDALYLAVCAAAHKTDIPADEARALLKPLFQTQREGAMYQIFWKERNDG